MFRVLLIACVVFVYIAAFFQSGQPIYSANYVRIRLGHAIEIAATDCDSAKKEYVWSYESPKFIMEQVRVRSPLVLLEDSFDRQYLCRLYRLFWD